MYLRSFILLSFLFTWAFADIDCSEQDTCFGEPTDCDPNRDCNTLFHFDVEGNLHLVVRNFSDPYGYAAFAVNQLTDDVIEYLICLPYHRQRHRAIAELGGLVSIVEENITGSIEFLGNRDFQCMFNVSDFPESFRDEQEFFVTRGTFRDVFVIYDGVPLYSLDDYVDYSLDDEKLRLRRRLQQKKKEKTKQQKEETVQQDYTGPHHDMDSSDSDDSGTLENDNLLIQRQGHRNLDKKKEPVEAFRDGLRKALNSNAVDKKRIDVYSIEKPKIQPVTIKGNNIENVEKESDRNAAQRSRIYSDGLRHDVGNLDYNAVGGRLQYFLHKLSQQHGVHYDGLHHDMEHLVTEAIAGNAQNGEKISENERHPAHKRDKHFRSLHHDININSGCLIRATMLFMMVLAFLV